MNSNLKFLQTWSVDDFKRTQQVDKIEIKRNDATGKFFFVYGFESGPCTHKVATGELTQPVVSKVCSANTGDMFMMLHQRGEGGAQTVATL